MEVAYQNDVTLLSIINDGSGEVPSQLNAENLQRGFFTRLNDVSLINKTEILNLINNFVVPRFALSVIYSYETVETDGVETYSAQADEALRWQGLVYSWLLGSYDRYKALIDAYEAKKATLLEDLKTKEETRTNDTPQSNSAGTYEDLNYENQYVRGEVSQSGGTPAQRLKDIEMNLSNIYEKWASEFKRFIYYSSL